MCSEFKKFFFFISAIFNEISFIIKNIDFVIIINFFYNKINVKTIYLNKLLIISKSANLINEIFIIKRQLYFISN